MSLFEAQAHKTGAIFIMLSESSESLLKGRINIAVIDRKPAVILLHLPLSCSTPDKETRHCPGAGNFNVRKEKKRKT